MTREQPDTTVNRERQRALYGAPLSVRVHRLTAALGVTQSRIAAAIGVSPAMLSQLVSGRRVKIGDPAVLTRLLALDERCGRGPVPEEEVPELLAQVRDARLAWSPLEPAEAAEPVAGDAAPPPGPRVPDAADPVPAPALVTRPAPPAVPPPRREPARPAPTADDALRGVTAPARLVAAAAALATSFPEIAEVLRRAASRPVR